MITVLWDDLKKKKKNLSQRPNSSKPGSFPVILYTVIISLTPKYHQDSSHVSRITLKSNLPYNSVRADDKLWPGVPLVIRDIVMSLQPNPLLSLCKESVVT